MTLSDLTALSTGLPVSHIETLDVLSRNDDGKTCLDSSLSCHALTAIKFDDIKDAWYNLKFFHQVRSADVLYKNGDKYYLIEFKTGKPDNFDLHRKLYDSVLGLMEHAVLTLDECRGNLQYLVVSLEYDPHPCHSEMLAHFDAGDNEPWEYEVSKVALKNWPTKDIRKLSGFLVENIYKLCPADFNKFVTNRKWSN